MHERDQKRARYAIQHISIYFNYIGKFENEVTQLAEPTEQEIRQMREEIEEAKKEKSRAYHRQYSREYRARNLEKQREYSRRYPENCKQTDTDPETGCMEFEVEKGRFSFRLTAPYSEERREAARQYARENSTTNLLKYR